MAKLAGFTEGTTKKFWPPVKRKAMEEHPELANQLTGTASSTTAAPKAAGKKRKAVDAEAADADAELDPKLSDTAEGNGTDSKPKKAPAKGKRGKKIKTEDAEAENNSADGGDGKREFVYKGFVVDWLNKTDEPVGEEEEV
jgi:hypothetical protein